MVLYGLVSVSGAKQAPAWNKDELPLLAVLACTPISEQNCLWPEGDADSSYETFLLKSTLFKLEGM